MRSVLPARISLAFLMPLSRWSAATVVFRSVGRSFRAILPDARYVSRLPRQPAPLGQVGLPAGGPSRSGRREVLGQCE